MHNIPEGGKSEKGAGMSGRELAAELQAISEQNQDVRMNIQDQKRQYDQEQVQKVEQMLERFPPESRHVVASVQGELGSVEVVMLGEPEPDAEIASIAERGLGRLQVVFGGKLADAMPGMKIYIADEVIEGGGEAIPQANAVILDAAKARMTVGEA
jgi:hypothetical protein